MVKCPDCGKELKNTQALSGHRRLKHGVRLVTKTGVLSKPVARLEKGGSMVSAELEKPCPPELFACGHTAETFDENCPLCQKRGQLAVAEAVRYISECLNAGYRVVLPYEGDWYELKEKAKASFPYFCYKCSTWSPTGAEEWQKGNVIYTRCPACGEVQHSILLEKPKGQ